ncbi:MAG: HDOD domain-containing protein [Mariprofundaceae bacterium]|nr:HDOD domain-containing protein [Mariprofundaceae bacterium]
MPPLISNRKHSLALIYEPHELLILPERFLKIHRLLSQTHASARALARIIETDIMISASVLKVANSSAYNPMNKPLASLSKAIARLGLATSAQISMSMSLFQDIRLPIALQHLRHFWTHSFLVSQLCLRMAEQLHPNVNYDTDDLLMAGLFHDIGCILIALHIDPIYFERDFLECHGAELCELEQQVYGLNHAEVGEIMLKQWGMPTSLIEIVANHHHPNNHVIATICSCADQFTHETWEALQYIEAAQDKVLALPAADIRAWMATSDLLRPLLK